MCGIAGIISRGSKTLGADLVNMLQELEHRGKDATGVALYEERDDVALRMSMTGDNQKDRLLKLLNEQVQVVDCSSYAGEGLFSFLEARLDMDKDKIADLNRALDSDANFCVHSIGNSLKVYKDGGSARDLRRNHTIKVGACSHGIGHVRMATESVENIDFAHPFTSYLLPELSLVHNGQFTNYFNMRRKMEARGIHFKTNNDSEMAAHYLAWEMSHNGLSMAEGHDQGPGRAGRGCSPSSRPRTRKWASSATAWASSRFFTTRPTTARWSWDRSRSPSRRSATTSSPPSWSREG